MSEKYNGWTNWETWNVNLWLCNNEGDYDMAKNCKDGNAIRELVEEYRTRTSGMFADLINRALDRVNWEEIYKGLHED